MAGRGSFIESYPLFGYALDDYDELFSGKLEMLLRIRESERVTWTGKHTQSLDNLGVYPRPIQNPLPVWIAVGGTPQSVVRAGALGLPLALAIIGGEPARFVPMVDLYRESALRAGHDPAKLQLSINSHGYIADSSRQAADEAFPAYQVVMSKIGRERGWPPLTRGRFEADRSRRGAILVGSADEVVEKILMEYQLFGMTRFLIQFSVGTMPHDKIMHSIELYGRKVAPVVRRETASHDLESAGHAEKKTDAGVDLADLRST
jgi:alkanesulfonate monooxygenase SsuD/methylene tetrahydromethanopterin reductase-like flavin-dependent oxidoreductase (luciferase family)